MRARMRARSPGGLILEAPRPDVDAVSELGQLLGELQDIDNLTAGIGCAERRVGGYISVG
jgi:hypothetical protein